MTWGHPPFNPELADLRTELNEARDRIKRLEERQQELLQTCVRLTNEVPFADEFKDWQSQRAKMVAEIGTLRAEVATKTLDAAHWRGAYDRASRELETYKAAVSSLHGMVDQTDPADPIGAALTKAGLQVRP